MQTSTPETNDSTLSGNCLKPLLGVALWFTLKKFRFPKRSVCGIKNKFFRVVKYPKKIYVYEFSDFLTQEYRQFYRGKKNLFLNKYILYIITFFYNLIGLPILYLCYYPFAYFDGARNFIKDGAWANNVKFFNWINFLSMIILLAILFFKSYA